MTRYLTAEQALRIARHATGAPVEVRDVGLLDAAVHRPRARALGHDAYPDLPTKAAALLHLLARNHRRRRQQAPRPAGDLRLPRNR